MRRIVPGRSAGAWRCDTARSGAAWLFLKITAGDRPMRTTDPKRVAPRPATPVSFRPRLEELEPRCLLSTVEQLFVSGAWQDLVGKPIAPGELARLSGRLDHG